MTTIFIDCNDKRLYTDSRLTSSFVSGDEIHSKKYCHGYKIYPLSGFVIAGAGDREEIDRFVKEYELGGKIKNPKNNNTIAVISSDGYNTDVIIYNATEYKGLFGKKYKYKITTHKMRKGFISFGSGGDYATGAYTVCGCAITSMEAAIERDQSTGGPISCWDYINHKSVAPQLKAEIEDKESE